MTVIRPNSISGGSSITGNGGDISIFRADGTAADVTVNNITSGVITATTFKGAVDATTGTFSGNLGVGGVLTYEDVANIDSVGVVTARSGINLVGNDLNVGSNIKIGNASGIVTATSFSGSGANLTGIDTDLVADTSPQLGGNLDANSKNILFGDTSGSSNNRLKFGAGSDLEISHNGTDSIIQDAGTGDLKIGGSTVRLTNAAINENMLVATENGAVELYHDNSKKIETSSSGVTVTGTLTATAFHGSGANLTSMPFIAEGGIESTFSSGGTTYMLHTFLTTGVFRTNGAKTIDFLLVGGGGGSAAAEGNSGASGGGGGGGVVEGSGFSLAAGTYVVTVGAGGAATNKTTVGGTGGDTIFAGVTAKGGGGGADYASAGGNGGSGGGGSEPNQGPGAEIQSSQNSGISNIAQFGSDGGQGGEYTSNPTGGGGGGGGAGGAGARPTSTDHGNGVGGAAGNGRANSITGTSTTYGRGGIGGGSSYLNAEAGLNGRGDGATGATAAGTEGSGAVGGSGIVIIRYTI